MHNLHNIESWFNSNLTHLNDDCGHCTVCRPIDCNQSECDRLGRCMCNISQCICIE